MARGPPLKKQPGLEIVLKSDWRECVERREVRVQMRERKRGEEGGREEERTLKRQWRVAGTDTRDQRPHPSPGCGWHFCSEASTDTFRPVLSSAKELSHLPLLLLSPLLRANEQRGLDIPWCLPVNITTEMKCSHLQGVKKPTGFL